MKNSSKFFVFLYALSAYTSVLYSINVKLLKGTHDILQKEDQYYAPFWGLPFIEEGVAEDLYDLSSKQIRKALGDVVGLLEKERNLQDQKVVLLRNVTDLKNTGTQNLVESLFYKVGGTFNITILKNNPVSFLHAKDIGFLMQKIKLRAFYRNLILEKLAQKAKISSEEFENLLQAFDVLERGSKIFNSFSTNKLVFVDQVFGDCLKAKLLKDPSLGKAWGQFVSSLKISLQECDPRNQDAIYPQNTTQGILLGYMLQKVASKKDLEDYFSSFLGHPIELPSEEYTLQEMNAVVDQPVDFKSVQKFADFICSSIYLKNYDASLPKIAVNKNVFFQGVEFTDCVENALRMICNIVTYDQSKKTFENNIALSKLLTSFYAHSLSADVSEVENLQVHQAWMELLQDIPGVKYAKIKFKDSTDYFDSSVDEFDKEAFAGFIPMVTIDTTLPKKNILIGSQVFTCYRKTIGNQTYLLVPKDSNLHCFEAHAFLSNIVFLLDYLFDLKIVANVADIFSVDFMSRYFLPIIEKLGLSVHSDEWKYKDVLIDLPFYKGRDEFVLRLKSIHAEVFVPSTKKIMPSYIGQDLFPVYPAEVSALVSLYNVDIKRLYDIVGLHNYKQLYQLITFVDVRLADAKLFLINSILNQNVVLLHDYVESLLLTLSNFSDQKKALDILFDRLKNNSKLSLLKKFIYSYISMIRVMKIKNNKNIKELLLYESFLFLLLTTQSEDMIHDFLRKMETVLSSNSIGDVKQGLSIAQLALSYDLISDQNIVSFVKPIIFCLANANQDVFDDATAVLFSLVKSGAVNDVDMIRFMLMFAQHCVTVLDTLSPAVRIITLFINTGIIRNSDMITTFDSVKSNKNISIQRQGLEKIINKLLSGLGSQQK